MRVGSWEAPMMATELGANRAVRAVVFGIEAVMELIGHEYWGIRVGRCSGGRPSTSRDRLKRVVKR